ncbi:MAG: hypothetical protein AABZ74_11945 [Cyanobacteriota bacterium]
MKKIFQILFFVFISLAAFAQEKKDSLPKAKESKWSIQLLGGTNYCYPTFHFPSSGSYKLKLRGDYKYGIILLVNRKVKKMSTLNMGISYNYLKYSQLQLSSTALNFDYTFTSFFLSFRQITNLGKLYGHIEFGLSGDYLLDNNYTDYNINIFLKVFPNKTITASLYISPGINYKINNTITLNAMVGFSKAVVPLKYEDNNTASGAPIKINNYYSYLIYNAGIQYNF